MVTSDVVTVADPNYKKRSKLLSAVSTSVVLLVAAIPIAIEVVTSTAMASGSHRLAERKVIVTRLGAIEELAGTPHCRPMLSLVQWVFCFYQ